MKSMTNLIAIGLIIIATVFYPLSTVDAQFPGSGQIPLAPASVPQFVDPLPHFAYPGARVDATTAWTPVTIEVMSNDQQALSTGTVLPNGTAVSPTNGLTHVWAYRISNGTDTFGPLWPR